MMRHWREKWDPEADLVFLRRLKMSAKPLVMVGSGDPVTDEIRETIGMHRLFMWWRGGFIGLAEFNGVSKVVGTPPQKKSSGGWQEIRFPNGTTMKVQGKKAVEKHMAACSDYDGLLSDGLTQSEAQAVVWPR